MKYKIIATKEQLESVGIDDRVMNETARFKQDYFDGFYEVAVTYNLGTDENKYMITNLFDIPKDYLEEINDGKL